MNFEFKIIILFEISRWVDPNYRYDILGVFKTIYKGELVHIPFVIQGTLQDAA